MIKEKAQWHMLSAEEVLQKLETSENGLSESEVIERKKKYGLNKISEVHKISAIKIFLSQFNSFLIYILLFASLISAFLKEWADFWVILAVIFLNSSLGFFQQYKAERAIEKLKHMLQPKAKVIREGILQEIIAEEVVPGDMLVLHEGDKIMADARIISIENLRTNEAVLTGESWPVKKIVEKIKNNISIADMSNMLFLGTTVIAGNGKAVVVATGMQTEFGKIATIVQEIKKEKTPLQEKLDHFSKQLGILIVFLIILTAVIGLLIGFDKLNILMTSVALAVAVIPEGLPIVITICLALAVQRMFKVKSLIRRLSSAETLGRVTVICSDKTGTITSEEMNVTELFSNNKMYNLKIEKMMVDSISERDYKFYLDGKPIEPAENQELMLLLKIGCLCNNARFEEKDDTEYIIGDPTERALVVSALGAGLSKQALTKEEPRVKEFSFTSIRKLMSIIRKKQKLTSYVKGSPEIILERCNSEIVNGKVLRLDNRRKKELIAVYEKMASSALRVLGFAYKQVRTEKIEDAEFGLTFVGFQGMFDSPRSEVKDAIKKCMDAGIKVKMLTGDSALTAKAVSKFIGLDTSMLIGREIKAMSDEELSKNLEKTTIFARIDPEDKVRIVSLLKKKNEIVALTGDGVNDAPALKKADIGIAMGIRGSDVTRDVADIVLTDDNFASIVNAVEEGRRIEDNIKNFVKYMLSVNFAELFIILLSVLLVYINPEFFLPLLPIQILWINLITDSIPALAIGVEKPDADIMKRKSKGKESILKNTLPFILIGSIVGTLAILYIFHFFVGHTSIERTRTIVFTTIIMFEMFFVFACRSDKPLSEIGFFSNKYIIYAILATIALQLIVLYTPISAAFKVVPLTLAEWRMILPVSFSGLFLFELWKIIKHNGTRKKLSNKVIL